VLVRRMLCWFGTATWRVAFKIAVALVFTWRVLLGGSGKGVFALPRPWVESQEESCGKLSRVGSM
jgi:hypothetical protein